MKLKVDDEVVDYIATFYTQEGGASSIQQAVRSKVEEKVRKIHLKFHYFSNF